MPWYLYFLVAIGGPALFLLLVIAFRVITYPFADDKEPGGLLLELKEFAGLFIKFVLLFWAANIIVFSGIGLLLFAMGLVGLLD